MDTTEGVSLTWRSLTVDVHIKTEHVFRNTTHSVKKLIHNANGYLKPNTLVAVMGQSGSGKSTLMSVLANRQLGCLKVHGNIQLNGQKIPPELMRAISGFVYQDDLFVPILTVSEHLHLAAQIKLDRRITAERRGALVNKILKDVGLTECANRFIGNSSDGDGNLRFNLSGGERKRLSVATELIINPALLFCDEPTTGLDSFSALKLITLMRNMANIGGKIVICSIHQPSAEILDRFHQIILMHEGKVAFSGTTENALEFFHSIGYSYNKEQNPADFLIKSLSVPRVPICESESIGDATKICLKFEESHYYKNICEQIDEQDNSGTDRLNGLENIKHIFWFHKLYLMTYREIQCIIRDRSLSYIKFIKLMLVAVLIGTCMKKVSVLNQESIQSIKGALSYWIISNFYHFLYVTLCHFPNKMPVFKREYSNNTNTPLIFYLSLNVSLLPELLLYPTLFTAVSYTLSGLRKSWFAFLLTASVTVIFSNISALSGILLSLVTNSYEAADSLVIIGGALVHSCTGITMNPASIPVILSWVPYVLWTSYAFESLLIVHFEEVKHIQCSKVADLPCLKTGEEVLNSLSFSSENLQRNVIVMSCMYIVFHLCNFTALKMKVYYLQKNG